MDISLYYKKYGTAGQPLILLHGNGENSEYFHHQTKFFSRYFQVYALDTRGHGRSPRGGADFTIRQFADDLKDFMDQQSIPAAHILGFSDGANIAMVFGMRYPDRVLSLILDGGNMFPSGVKARFQIPVTIGYWLSSIGRCFARVHELLSLMVVDPNLCDVDLAHIQAPTMVMAGTRDVIRESHTKQIAQAIPHSSLRFIEGDHFIAEKNWQAFNRAVLDFYIRNQFVKAY